MTVATVVTWSWCGRAPEPATLPYVSPTTPNRGKTRGRHAATCLGVSRHRADRRAAGLHRNFSGGGGDRPSPVLRLPGSVHPQPSRTRLLRKTSSGLSERFL